MQIFSLTECLRDYFNEQKPKTTTENKQTKDHKPAQGPGSGHHCNSYNRPQPTPPALRSEPVPVLHGRCPPATARSGPVRTCAPHSCGWQTRAKAQQVSGVRAGGGGNGGPWEHAPVCLSRHGPPRSSPTRHAGDRHQQPLVPSVETTWDSGDQCRLSHIQGCWERGDDCDLWAGTGPS